MDLGKVSTGPVMLSNGEVSAGAFEPVENLDQLGGRQVGVGE